MRVGIIIIALSALLTGCASKPQPSASAVRLQADQQYADASAPTLVFDAPITQGNPRMNLARDPRQASAFVGFDQTITTFFYVRSDDRQTDDRHDDRYERRAISEQFGTSYR